MKFQYNPQLRFFAAVIILAGLAALSYSLYTNQQWEDFFITFRYSKNLIEGKGLVYNLGDRVHGFTSPIGTLLLALCYLLTGKTAYLAAFWLFRAISILVFTGSCLFLSAIFYERNSKNYIAGFLVTLYILEIKSVAFSANGMETAFMLLFLAWFIFLISRDMLGRYISGGICWAGLMWTRPDGLVYILALSLASFIFSASSKRTTAVNLLKMACVCAVLYSPWLIWSFGYYGSPIPNTIQAKLNYYPFQHCSLQYIAGRFLLIFQYIFGPIYYISHMTNWPAWVEVFSLILGVFSFFYWLFPSKDRTGKIVSFGFFLVCFYFLSMNKVFPWYFPPLTMMALIVLVNGVFKLAGKNKGIAAFAILSIVGLAMSYIFLMTAIDMKIWQDEIADKNLKKIGLWLKENVRPSERVYLEPLGYIGYFSGARMVDYPGLVSPDVVRLKRQRRGADFYTLAPELKPEWLVLRPLEAKKMLELDYVRNNYAPVKAFDVVADLNKHKKIHTRAFLLSDATFVVYKKTR